MEGLDEVKVLQWPQRGGCEGLPRSPDCSWCPSDMSEALEDFQVGFSSHRGRGCRLGLACILGSSCYQVSTGTMALAAIPGECAWTRPSQTWLVVFGVPLGLSGGFSRSRGKCPEIMPSVHVSIDLPSGMCLNLVMYEFRLRISGCLLRQQIF